MKTIKVVSSFLIYDSQILLLKRSQLVGSNQGRWAGVSGYLELPNPLDQAYKEILEETGIPKNNVQLIKEGDFVEVPDSKKDDVTWRIYPFLFSITTPENIVLDWEHDEMAWVYPSDIKNFNTIPHLHSVLSNLITIV